MPKPEPAGSAYDVEAVIADVTYEAAGTAAAYETGGADTEGPGTAAVTGAAPNAAAP